MKYLIIAALGLCLAACAEQNVRRVTGTVDSVQIVVTPDGAGGLCTIRYNADGDRTAHIEQLGIMNVHFLSCRAINHGDRISVIKSDTRTRIDWDNLQSGSFQS